jgi:GT2 family glycosyltransferase
VTLSIIIPVHGQLHLLMGCLASLTHTLTSPAELILVDDASKEFDLTTVPLPVKGTVIRMATNGGFSQACNAGASQATGDILLFLNSDTEAHTGWELPLLEAFDSNVAIVGPKLTYPASYWCPICRVYQGSEVQDKGHIVCLRCGGVCEAVETIQSCGGLFDARKGPYHRYLGWRADDWRVNVKESVSWVTGAVLAIRADVFKAAGGFDVGYIRGYFEDVALCCQVRKAGWVITYEPKANFTHLVAQSSSNDDRSEMERRLQFRANSRRFHLQFDDWIIPDTKSAVYVDY